MYLPSLPAPSMVKSLEVARGDMSYFGTNLTSGTIARATTSRISAVLARVRAWWRWREVALGVRAVVLLLVPFATRRGVLGTGKIRRHLKIGLKLSLPLIHVLLNT